MTLSLGLDLGTTRIKAGALGRDGRLERVISAPVPPLSGTDPIRESDAVAYVAAAETLLAELAAPLPRGTPVGIAFQRSTFVLWDPRSGAPVAPMISWVDRRAADWCERHRSQEDEVIRTTGLRLSAHYAGPKLATLLSERPALGEELATGRIVFGNLDRFALRSWSGAGAEATDLTMGARTLLLDLARGDWSEAMLLLFEVPRACLPEIRPTVGRRVALRCGATLTAAIADQAASVLAALRRERDGVLVNLGTGGFVLRIVGAQDPAPAGYLRAPVLPSGDGEAVYALEGTINGVAASVDRLPGKPTPLPEEDPTPDALCIPDAAGVGSPHWLPLCPQTFHPAAASLPPPEVRRIVLEGIVFRVREIVEDLCGGIPRGRVLLAGGVTREPFLAKALASCLGRPIELAEQGEATLLGAATLAAGIEPAPWETRTVSPGSRGAYLASKFRRWRSWVRSVTDPAGAPPG